MIYSFWVILMFDGIYLSKIKNELLILETGRISKVNEISDTDFIFTIRAQRKNYNLLISLSSEYSRIHLATRIYDNVLSPHAFTMLLRKHIEGYFIENIKTYKSDRIMSFTLKGYNEMQDLTTKYLYIEVMGRYSNLILTDKDNYIIDALKHDGVSEFQRTILPNALYQVLESGKLDPLEYSQDELENIFNERNIKTPKDVINNFNGVSQNILFETFKSDFYANKFYSLLHLDNNPSIIINPKGREDFNYNPYSYEVVKSYDTLSQVCEEFFYLSDQKAKVKQKTGNLLQFIEKKIVKLNDKLARLNQELIETQEMDSIRIKGELLQTVLGIHERKNSVNVFNYYDNTYIDIKLDPELTVIENSKKLFKKYEKIKTSVKFIQEQIEITKSEIDYFNELKYEVDVASLNEALQIKDELIEGKYLFEQKSNNKKRKEKPHLLTYILPSSSLVSVGKNNIQNNYLTWTYAKSNELWFHVKDQTGSHVVLHKTDDITDDDIRYASMIAAFYSSSRDSSSVAVDYTLVRNIKKVPGRKGSFVTYKNQKTIYIDPDKSIIDKLEVKRI